MEILRITSLVIGMALAGYSLITKNFEFMPYLMFFVGVLMLVTGVAEFQAKRKSNAISSILAAAFLFFVAIYTF